MWIKLAYDTHTALTYLYVTNTAISLHYEISKSCRHVVVVARGYHYCGLMEILYSSYLTLSH